MEWISLLAIIVPAITFSLTAVWALYLYRQSLVAQATRWSIDLFRGFYMNAEIARGRRLIEYDYETRLVPMIELQAFESTRSMPLTQQERQDLEDLDLVLNYLEQLIYLQTQKAVRTQDTSPFFNYWLGLMKLPRYSGLRRYLRNCDYEALADHANVDSDEYMVFYGTLMSDSPRQSQLDIQNKLTFIRDVTLTGTMVEKSTYPGLVQGGDSLYRASVYRVLDNSAIEPLDEFEDYYPDNQHKSEFLRRSIWIPEINHDAWVYYLNPTYRPDDATVITDPSWTDFVRRTGKQLPSDLPPSTHRP